MPSPSAAGAQEGLALRSDRHGPVPRPNGQIAGTAHCQGHGTFDLQDRLYRSGEGLETDEPTVPGFRYADVALAVDRNFGRSVKRGIGRRSVSLRTAPLPPPCAALRAAPPTPLFAWLP